MSEMKWSPKMEALAQKHYTPEQLNELRARPFTAEDQARVGAAWAQVFADIDALGANADPTSPQALDIGRRAQALIAEFTQGDPALFQAGRRDEPRSDGRSGTRAANAHASQTIGSSWAACSRN